MHGIDNHKFIFLKWHLHLSGTLTDYLISPKNCYYRILSNSAPTTSSTLTEGCECTRLLWRRHKTVHHIGIARNPDRSWRFRLAVTSSDKLLHGDRNVFLRAQDKAQLSIVRWRFSVPILGARVTVTAGGERWRGLWKQMAIIVCVET